MNNALKVVVYVLVRRVHIRQNVHTISQLLYGYNPIALTYTRTCALRAVCPYTQTKELGESARASAALVNLYISDSNVPHCTRTLVRNVR